MLNLGSLLTTDRFVNCCYPIKVLPEEETHMKTISIIHRFAQILLLTLGVLSTLTAEAAGPEPAGWYAGDIHVHRSCGGSPVSISSIYNAMVNQDLAVVSVLADMGNGEVQNPSTDLPKVTGQDDPVSTAGRIVHWDAEWHWDATYFNYPHQALGGHIVALGLTQAQQVWEEYTYPIFQWVHQRNGIGGFAHLQYLGDGIPQNLNCCIPIEYPVEVALGACDFISEDVAGSDTAMRAYYRLLNCGFRPGFAGGSDYPCNASIGSVVTYTQPQGGLTYRAWIDAIARGRTVVSRNGHNEFLELKVNNSATPGDEIQLTGAANVSVNVQWLAKQNLSGSIEIVQNGVVVASSPASVSSSTPATFSTTINFTRSGWLAARRMSSRGHELQTGAVFVIVNSAPIRASVDDASFYVAWMDDLLTKTAPGGVWSSYFVNSRDAARARYQAARNVFQQIAAEAGSSQPLVVTTTALPAGALNTAYAATLTASGGVPPYTWSFVDGSLPPGLSLNATSGAITGMPSVMGTYNFTIRASDTSSPKQTATQALSVTVTQQPATVSIWPATATPTNIDEGPDSPVELGVKFRADVPGSVVGIRFYKAATNTGTHVGNLWSNTGTRLATATFSGETASGWQEVRFAAPVSITANTVYIASYHANNGHYSADSNYFSATGVDNPPLHALADGASGGNGVYAYGSNSVFPTQTWNTSNYWVDVLFQPGPAPELTSLAIIPTTPTISIGATQQFTATGTYSDGSTQNVTSQVSWLSSTPAVAAITASGLATGQTAGTTTISASLSGKTASTLVTVQPSPGLVTIWPDTAVPSNADGGPDRSVELGVKFRSDVAGTVVGIRFYKSSANIGTHVANLWSNAGQRLATATFSGETASGWQQVNFSTPVAITANTIYVASYHANTGHYSKDVSYFASAGVDRPPLHALANGVSGGNGVYRYGSNSAFPNKTGNASNYWVDVVFRPNN